MTLDVDAAMGRALELAAAAQEWGDTPIGAVVLGPDGAVLAEAANEREKRGDPTAHAEVLALRAAAQVHGDGWRLTGATLVVTLEPCTMCAGASVLARVAGWSTAPTTRRPGRPVRCGTSSATAGSTTGPRSPAGCGPRSPPRCYVRSSALSGACSLFGGGVSERPKEHASKACEGNPLRGFKSHRHRQLTGTDPTTRPRRTGGASSPRVGGALPAAVHPGVVACRRGVHLVAGDRLAPRPRHARAGDPPESRPPGTGLQAAAG